MEKIWVNIPDVLFFQEGPGVRNTQYTTEGVKLLNVANLVDGKVDLSTSDRYISEEEANGKYKHFLCDAGDFIIASSGIKVEYIDKKMGFVDESMLPLCMNTSTIRFKVLDEQQLRIRFFMYYLKSQHFKEQLFKQITGSAQLNYGPSHLKKMIMPLIDIDKQDEIIACMDKVQAVIEKRQQELVMLDDLIKARFVELFGDFKQTTTIARYISELRGGKSLAGTEKCKNKVLKTGAATFGWFDPEQYKYLPTDYDPLPEHKVETGDVIISRMNTPELVGACSYVFEAPDDMYYPDRLWKVIPQAETNPIFLWQLLWDREIRRQIKEKSGGTSGTMHNISKPKLLEIKCIDAPIELQEQFADFVKQVDKSKVAVQKALNEAQLLFDSLMQKYFG